MREKKKKRPNIFKRFWKWINKRVWKRIKSYIQTRWEMIKARPKGMFLIGAGEGVLLFLIAGVAVAIVLRIVRAYMCSSDSGAAGYSGYIEAMVAALSAGFVVWQLSLGEKQSEHQTGVEEAEFILDFNRSFIENEKLTEIERYLECRMTGAEYATIKKLEAHRQEMVNYLVYLEGLASCVHSGVLSFEKIDDLLGYRFFLAMDHIEPQIIDLLPFAPYYRGCFRLYEEWLEYRMSIDKYSEENDWGLPLYSTALCNHYGYEKYACPDMTFRVSKASDSKLILESQFSKKIWVKLSLEKNGDGPLVFQVDSSKKLDEDSPTYIALLRRAVKELAYADETQNEALEDVITFEPTIGDGDAVPMLREWGEGIEEKKIEGNATAKKLFDAIIYTKTVLLTRELSRRNELDLIQLDANTELSDENMKEIAALIYDTDKYIYKDMFGNKQAAVAVLPALLKGDTDKMFRKEYLYICRVCGRVMGIILWHKGVLDWDSGPLEDEMAKLSGVITVPRKWQDRLRRVSQEYVAKYNGPDPVTGYGTISILNVCTAPDVRGMDVARKMLKGFLAEHKTEDIELCVLSNNKSAIKLYEKVGFERNGAEQAYPRTLGPEHRRDIMKKRGKKW